MHTAAWYVLSTFSVHIYPQAMGEVAQIVVYLTSDVPRTRVYPVNHTHTAHVRLLAVFGPTSLKYLPGSKFRDTSQDP